MPDLYARCPNRGNSDMGQLNFSRNKIGRPCVASRVVTPEYQHYQDHEWGFPVQDDRRLFEKVCLEGFQAGLSWLTILKKREAFRRGFASFVVDQVAGFGESETRHSQADHHANHQTNWRIDWWMWN